MRGESPSNGESRRKFFDKLRVELFHRYAEKLLFMSKRGRPDLRTMISFLKTRVQSPDEDDWKNLIRLIKFLMVTMMDALTLK